MNRKAFAVAILFLCVALVWLGINIYWAIIHRNGPFDLGIAIVFVVAGCGMAWSESQKKKRQRLDQINKHKIP